MTENHAGDRSAVLARLIEAVVGGDEGALAELVTDDVRFTSPVVEVTSLAALIDQIGGRDDAFSDIRVDLGPADVVGDRGYAEWVAQAVHSGALVVDDFTIEPTGRTVTLRGAAVVEFAGERVSAVRQYWNEADLLDGLGLLDE